MKGKNHRKNTEKVQSKMVKNKFKYGSNNNTCKWSKFAI